MGLTLGAGRACCKAHHVPFKLSAAQWSQDIFALYASQSKPNGTFPEVGGIDHSDLEQLDLDRLPQAKIVYFDAEPGDVIVHHWATLHCSTGNTSSDRIRRAASVRFACDGCRYLPRRSSPEPFRNTIDIAPGAKLESSERWTQAWP